VARRGKSGGDRRLDRHAMIASTGFKRRITATVALLLLLGAFLPAQTLEIPQAAQASPTFDAVKATDAYLATVPADKKARSDAYFEGGYWIQLWSFLYGAAVLWLLLATGMSAAMRDRAEGITRVRALQPLIYVFQFIVVTTIARFPLSLYTGFVREHQYGLATQTFGPWLGDQLKGLGVGLVFGGLVMTALYAVLRRVGRSWWLWATFVVVFFSIIGAVIAPVFVAPLFNTYTRLTDPAIREPVLSMAHANGIKADDVYVVDQSRQTTRISANVSGLLGTERISLNDNLLKRTSLEEIESVLGHEMGHYVLNHVYKGLLATSIVGALGFALVASWFERVRLRKPEWQIGSVSDVAGLPLIALLFSVYSFATTPISNTLIRVNEYEADIFGLNASRQPDGFASAALKLGEYRKLDPGPIEELIFFDHPSGRTRIFSAMRWKKENLQKH
jgi:STE24 endopeptidase